MKMIKPILAMVFLVASVLTISDKVFGQSEWPKIKPGKKYRQSGAKLASPNEPDWSVVKSEALETAFSKSTADKKFTAFVKTVKIPVYESERDLLVNLEKLKMAEIDEANRDSLHFNYTQYKSAPCLQYDGIFNAPQTAYKYWNMYGYMCCHPDNKDVIIQFEFSNYSNDRGYLESEMKLSKLFFEGIKFSKVK